MQRVPNFHIWVSFFKCNKQFIEIAQNQLPLFANTFLYVYIILFPRKLSAVFIIHIKSMYKINCFLGHCFTFFLGRLCMYPFASVLLQIELNTLKLQSIQNNTFVTKNQEPKPIFAIFLYLKW